MARPNILLLMSDQHNAKCLGCYGHDIVRTPNLDRLAWRGLCLPSAFAQTPICTPSRMCFLTSQYAHNHGYYGLKGPKPWQLPTLFAQLKGAGYFTGAIGKIHLPDDWLEPDCQFFCEGAHGRARARESYKNYLLRHGVADGADDVMRQRRAAGRRGQSVDGRPDFLPKELSHDGYAVEMAREFFRLRPSHRPFFLWFTLSKPHQEYRPAREFWDLYGDGIPMPPNADDDPSQKIHPLRRTVEHQRLHPPADLEPADYASLRRRKMRGYFGNISHMDWAMGEVLAMVEDQARPRDTLVVYTSDHGDFACEHGLLEKAPGISSDAICRIPMIWSWPEHLPDRDTRDQLVESVDFWPTIARLVGLPGMSMWDGKDISDILLHNGPDVRAAAFTENPLIKSIATRKWRMTYVPADMYPDDPVRGELYDREKDPWERYNLYHDPQHQAVVQELRSLLLDWLVTSTHPVSALPVLAHPSLADAESEHVAGNAPYPEDGRTSPAQLRKAIREGRDNYL